MKKSLLIFGLAALVSQATLAQRYATEIFDSNDVTSDVSFGFNINPLFLAQAQADPAGFAADMLVLSDNIDNGVTPTPNYFTPNSVLPEEQQTVAKLTLLEMDIYTPPADDDVTERPLVIYLHTGNFLPPLFNGGITGDKIDSAAVNICKQFARRGYVAASINYRLGWNPTSTDPDVRRGTLLQAVYRALHDTQTAVRYLRKTAAEGNPYGIDVNKVVLFGQGSGGYVAQAYVTLDNYIEEIASLDKFNGNNGPYVNETIDGTIDGGPGLERLIDPLQDAGIDRTVQMAINAGGALADISWLDAGEAPMLTFHCLRDPFAPFDDGTVVVPTTNENVVDVSGGNVFIQAANDFNNNAAFAGIPDGDVYTDRARATYGQTYEYIYPNQTTMTVASTPEGLFPFLLPITPLPSVFFNESGPWDWWDFATLEVLVDATNAATGQDNDAAEIDANGIAGNPGMGPDKGLAYIDTIQGYANPRIMCVLELEGAVCSTGISENELDNSTSVYPNPATSNVQISNNEEAIRQIRVYDVSGRLVESVTVNAHNYVLERGNLKDGVYIMEVTFDENSISRKVVFN
jgi:hypothetical protein